MCIDSNIKANNYEIISILERVKEEISSGVYRTISYHDNDESMELTGRSFEAEQDIHRFFDKIIEYYNSKDKNDKAMCKAILFNIGGFFEGNELNHYHWLGEPNSSMEYLLMEALELTHPKELIGKVFAKPQCYVCDDEYTIDVAMRVYIKETDDLEILLGIECDMYDSQYSDPQKAEQTLNRINDIKMRENIEILQYTATQIYNNCIDIAREIWNHTTKLYKQKYYDNEYDVCQNDNTENLDEIVDRRKPKKPLSCMTDEEVSAHYRLANNKKMLTIPELKFYQNTLRKLCDDLQLVPLMKVRVNDIIDINEIECINDFHYRLNVAMLHFDFVLIKPENTEIVCVIELDDTSHLKESENDNDKNKLCQMLNIPLLRVSTCPEKNNKCIEIHNSTCTKDCQRSKIATCATFVNAPLCRSCGSKMIEKPNPKATVLFWSCPKCIGEKYTTKAASSYIYV